jgi:hypothetical protein
MKKTFFLLLGLLALLAACTDSPTEPGVPGGGGASGYTVTLTPGTGSAFITGDTVLGENEIIEITATVRLDGTVVTDRIQVIFEVIGTGAAFVETGTAYFNTYTVNGAALATLYSTATGTFTVKATARITDNTSAMSSKTYTFFEDPHLSVTGVSPATGASSGGETVTITGTGFMQPLEVYFGNERGEFISGTSTEMTVRTPVHYPSDCNANDVVDVRVVIFPGQTTESSDTLANAFTYLFEAIEPGITGIDPNHGDTDGGTLVTIYGSNFYCGEGVIVYFQGNSPVEVAAPIVSCSSDKLVVQAPPAHDLGIDNCTDPVNVRVLNLCGGLSYNLAGSFKYGPDLAITSWGPTQGPSTGGTQVVIYGQGFDSPVAVSFAGVGAFPTSVANNELMATTGVYDPQGSCRNETGPICVTDIECGTQFCTENDAFTYIVPELFVSAITPTQGYDGTVVTIYGQGLIPNLEVLFGDTNAVVTGIAADYSSITVEVPLYAGEYDTLPCTTGALCPGTQAQPTPVDVTVRSLFTGCSYTFKSFFYNPANPMPAPCLQEPPTCSVAASVNACNITWNVAPVCGATYTWIPPGACPNPGNAITMSCNFAASGTYVGQVTVTNSGGAANCSATGSIAAGTAGCP